jgi:serine/threonine protein kinase/WD40 repeat protein
MSSSSAERNPVDRLAEEFAERFRRGERPSLTEYTDRYPELAEQIRELFPALVVMERLKPADATGAAGAAGTATPDGTPLQVLGDYRIVREVGRGGMGVVYEAEQVSLGRHVALKVLPAQALANATYLERFRREAKAAARLHHTNIVPVYGVGEHDGVHFYAMQFIAGEGLDRVLHDVRQLRPGKGPAAAALPTPGTVCAASVAAGLLTGQFAAADARPEPADPTSYLSSREPSHGALSGDTSGPDYYRSVARLGVQVADALAYAHKQGVLHRDIKPSNLLLDAQGTVWVTDFGLAKAEGADELTQAGDIVGTLRYMAPERFDGHSLPQGDVYSLGLTLYELLTLRPAFDDANRGRLIERVLHEPPARPRKFDRRIPRDLETVVLKCLAKDPAERYATAEALAEDLRRFLGDRPIKARRTPWYEHTGRWCRRNPTVASLVGVVVVLAVALLVGTLVANSRLRGALGDANVRLWESLRDRARAVRTSGRAGQRLEALQSIREALALPLPPGHSRAELRTEAIAALALPDLAIEKEWDGFPHGTVAVAFDARVQRYARLTGDATVTVRRVADDTVLLPPWKEEAFSPLTGYCENYLKLSPDGRHVTLYHPGLRRLRVRRLEADRAVLAHDADHLDPWGWHAFSPDGTLLVYSRDDGRVAVLELAGGTVRHLPEPLAEPTWPRVSPDGKCVAVATHTAGQYAVELRDLATGGLTARLVHPEAAVCPAWHPDGQVLATFCGDRRIRLWDVPGGKVLRVLEGHRAQGGTLVFDGASGLLLSSDWGGMLRLWEPTSGRQLLTFQAFDSLFLCNHVRGVLPARTRDGKLRVLRLHPGRVYRTLSRAPTAAGGGFAADGSYEPVFSADGRLLFAATRGSSAAGVSVLDAATGRELNRIALAKHRPLLWGPGSELLTSGPQGVLRWPVTGDDARPGHLRLGPPQSLVQAATDCRCAASPDGRTFAVANHSRGVLVGHAAEGGRLLAVGPQQDVRYVAVSPDGRRLAAGSHGNSDGFGARVWDARTGQPVKALRVPGFCRVAFSPDGGWLLTTGGGSRLWRTDTWEEGPVLGGDACFAPDSRLLAVADEGGMIRLLEPASAAEVVRLAAPARMNVMPLGFSPDGTRLVAGEGETETLILWDLRALREDLQALGLDWEALAYPPAAEPGPLPRLDVDVDLGDAAPEADADRLVAQARNQLRSGRAELALAGLRRAVQTDPAHREAHNALAWLLLTGPAALRNPAEALALARKAAELAPDDAHCLNTLGIALYRSDRFAEAVPVLEKSLAAGPGQLDAHDLFFLAMCHARLGDAAKARACFDRAVRWWEGQKELTGQTVEELTAFRAEAEGLLPRLP